jgi:transient receptor potential cation channel subfamily M protein 3
MLSMLLILKFDYVCREFRRLSLELLEHCYQQDDAQTLQLLTYELRNWGNHTCLSLAVIANNKEFLAHPWFGGSCSN